MVTASLGIREIFGSKLGRTARHWRRAVDEKLVPFGLTDATWLPLLYVARGKVPIRQKDLAELVGIESSTLVRLVRCPRPCRVDRAPDRRGPARQNSPPHRTRPRTGRAGGSRHRRRARTGFSPGIGDEELAITLNVLDRIRAALVRAGAHEPAHTI